MAEEEAHINKEEALKEFLKSLKISLKNASIYSKEHPAFIKSVEEVKSKIDPLFKFLSPIKISFTPNALLIEDEYFEKERLYREIARIFHFRKIKNIEIKKGIILEELSFFLGKLSLPLKDLLKEGGLSYILGKKKTKFLTSEELDYSQLLKGEGKEIKDIWIYLLNDALEKEDIEKIHEFADNFEKIVDSVEINEFLEDEELWESMNKFFSYLRVKEKDRYRKCAKDFVKAILRAKNIPLETKFEKIKIFFAELSGDDFASALWEEIVTNEKFDSMSFNIFSNLLDRKKHEEVANTLSDFFQSDESLTNRPEIREKIRELFFDTSNPVVSEIYRRTLSSFLKSLSFEKQLSLDRDHLLRNYHLVLIRLLEEEKQRSVLRSVLDRIWNEVVNIFERKDWECLKFLFKVLNTRRIDLITEAHYKEINRLISEFIEKSILDGEVNPKFEYFLDTMRKSTVDLNVYLEKIFTEKKITPYILRSFFVFFKDDIFYFNVNLDQKASHTIFLERMIENLRTVDHPLSFETLKNIFSIGNRSLKLKALKAMQNISKYNEDIILPILKKRDFSLKKEALKILVKKGSARQKAYDTLFFRFSPFGIKNKILHENLRLVENEDFIEKEKHLIILSKKKFFWNRRLREHASRILGL